MPAIPLPPKGAANPLLEMLGIKQDLPLPVNVASERLDSFVPAEVNFNTATPQTDMDSAGQMAYGLDEVLNLIGSGNYPDVTSNFLTRLDEELFRQLGAAVGPPGGNNSGLTFDRLMSGDVSPVMSPEEFETLAKLRADWQDNAGRYGTTSRSPYEKMLAQYSTLGGKGEDTSGHGKIAELLSTVAHLKTAGEDNVNIMPMLKYVFSEADKILTNSPLAVEGKAEGLERLANNVITEVKPRFDSGYTPQRTGFEDPFLSDDGPQQYQIPVGRNPEGNYNAKPPQSEQAMLDALASRGEDRLSRDPRLTVENSPDKHMQEAQLIQMLMEMLGHPQPGGLDRSMFE